MIDLLYSLAPVIGLLAATYFVKYVVTSLGRLEKIVQDHENHIFDEDGHCQIEKLQSQLSLLIETLDKETTISIKKLDASEGKTEFHEKVGTANVADQIGNR